MSKTIHADYADLFGAVLNWIGKEHHLEIRRERDHDWTDHLLEFKISWWSVGEVSLDDAIKFADDLKSASKMIDRINKQNVEVCGLGSGRSVLKAEQFRIEGEKIVESAKNAYDAFEYIGRLLENTIQEA